MAKEIISRRDLLRRSSAVLGAGLTRQASLAAAGKKENEDNAVKRDAMQIPAWYYQHFDADFSLETPELGFGGWKKADLEFSRSHTAVVVMHAWEAGRSPEDYPGWWRTVPYIPRANAVLERVFPPLLEAVRASDLPLFHVVGGGDYYKGLPGYRETVKLAGDAPPAPERVESDPIRDELNRFRMAHVHYGAHNGDDIRRGFSKLDFAKEARPEEGEGIAENGHQLFALCREHGINHLVYCGFAINWCLLLSPGGMNEMQRHGLMCSTLRQATVAVENRESAPQQLEKEFALWRTALSFGFVFDVDDFTAGISG